MAKSREGNILSAKTEGQKEYIRSVAENDVTICEGMSGVGKSFIAVGLAAQYLRDGRYGKVLFTRSIVGSGRELGAFPGSISERISPYFVHLVDYFVYFLGKSQFTKYIDSEQILFYPVEILRGHNYENTFMCLEEGQNCTPKQIKLFLSRMSTSSTAVILGDIKQSDIYDNGLSFCLQYLVGVPRLSVVKLDVKDIQRHPILGDILEIFDKHGI